MSDPPSVIRSAVPGGGDARPKLFPCTKGQNLIGLSFTFIPNGILKIDMLVLIWWYDLEFHANLRAINIISYKTNSLTG